MEEREKLTWMEAYPKTNEPTMEEIGEFVDSSLFEELCHYVETEFACKYKIEFSGCSMLPGWNMKYKKSGKPVCTIYPDYKHFQCLVSTNQKMQPEADLFLAGCCDYTKNLAINTPATNGGKWLVFDVTDETILHEVMELIAIRVKKNK